MGKRRNRVTKAQATAHLRGHQQTAGGFAFDPTGALAGQNSAWGAPWWALQRPSEASASKTLDYARTQRRLAKFDPPTVEEMPSFSVNLAPTI